VKKSRLNRLNFEKTNRFGFISLKLKKPNRTQTEKNRAKPEKTEQNREKQKKLSQTGLKQFLS
jgi:hypothetical protein